MSCSQLLVSTKLRRKRVKMMKYLLIFAAVLNVTASKAATGETIQLPEDTLEQIWPEYSEITQKVDHFNYSDTRTWQMIYKLHIESYKPGGALFVYIGNGNSYGNEFDDREPMFDKLVKKHNGAHLVCWHRHDEHFFGTMENLQYLTVEQSLADLSYLIRSIKKTHDMKNSNVILGGSYIYGSLATWFKILYPDLVNGVWASGAPLLAKADFSEYYELLGQSIKQQGDDACYNRIKNGFFELELMLANNHTAEVKQMFNLCPSFDGSNDLDVSAFFSEIFLKLDFIIQHHMLTIRNICDIAIKLPSDVSAIVRIFVSTSRKSCIDSSYRFYLDRAKDSYDLPKFYLQCNQLGWFATSSSAHQPFGSKCPLSFFTTVCKDVFGNKFTKNYIENRVREFNDIYGGNNLNLENVYWTYGELDPWRALGITDNNAATFIPACVEDCNSYATGFDSNAELDASHKKLTAFVTEWLK